MRRTVSICCCETSASRFAISPFRRNFPGYGMSCETPRPTYAKSLFVYPANGRGLPTLICCKLNCGSGSVETWVGTCLAACQPCRAPSICGLFFSASPSKSASGVTTCSCCGVGSCANAPLPRDPTSSKAQRTVGNLVPKRRGVVFHFTSKDICLLLNVRIERSPVGASPCRPEVNRRMKETIGTEKETLVRSRTVQERIRSGRKNEACRVLEANAVEPRIPSQMLGGRSLPLAKQEYRKPP